MRYNIYRLYGYVKETQTVDKHDIIIVILIWILALAVAIGGIAYMNYSINGDVHQAQQLRQQQGDGSTQPYGGQ